MFRVRKWMTAGMALVLLGTGVSVSAFEVPERTKLDIAAWDAYAMALVSGGRKGTDLLVLSTSIGGPGGRAAAEQLLKNAPSGEELEHVLLLLRKLWKSNPSDHRLAILALDLAAAGGGSPLIPEFWNELAAAGETSGVAPGELWKLWSCGIICAAYGYASPALFERLPLLLNDAQVPLDFRLPIASEALNACEKAILFRQLAGETADAEQTALNAAKNFLVQHVSASSEIISLLKQHGGTSCLRTICEDKKLDPKLRLHAAALIGETGVLQEPEIVKQFPSDVLRRFQVLALLNGNRFSEAESLAQQETKPHLRLSFLLDVARKQNDYRKVMRILQKNRETLDWDRYCNELLRAIHHCRDLAAWEALQAENEKRAKETGKPVSPESFNNFFYIGLELGAYDGKLTPELLERLENLPCTAESLDTFAWALFRSGSKERAEEMLLQALRRTGIESAPVILEHYGDISAALNKWRQAERCYRLALHWDRSGESELSPQCAKKQAEALQKCKAASPVRQSKGARK